MATLCLRRFCANRFVFRQIYNFESVGVSPLTLFAHDVRIRRLTTHATRLTLPHCSSAFRCYSVKPDSKSNSIPPGPPERKTLLQRFKQMYRDYWYVLVPVHLITSAGWFGGFYYLAKSGVDIAGLLESWHVSEKITNSLKDSSMGYIAVAYALYKVATPLRYTVTLGGTTISINYLKEWGYIKPVPSAEKLKGMYQERKENIMDSIRGRKELYKEKKDNIIETVRETRVEFKKHQHHFDQKNEVVKDIKHGLEKITGGNKELIQKSKEFVKTSKKD